MKYNLDNLNNKGAKIKYKEQKNILNISLSKPEILYQDFNYFVYLLYSNNNIMVWTGLMVLGNLAKVDVENKIDGVIPIIISKLNAGKMITAGHAMRALINIIISNPNASDFLACEILKSKDYQYDTEECSHIHIGHMFKCIEMVWDLLSYRVKKAYIALAEKEVNNARSATASKASLFLRKVVKIS